MSSSAGQPAGQPAYCIVPVQAPIGHIQVSPTGQPICICVPMQAPFVQMQMCHWPNQSCQIVGMSREMLAPQVIRNPASMSSESQLSTQAACVKPREGQKPVSSITGQVWRLSRDSTGCREVQSVLGCCTDEEHESIVAELKGHVWEALNCPHANYVIQKCIATMRPQACQFIIDELERKVTLAARLKYGCRIVQRLFEHCRHDQLLPVCEEILADVIHLARHPYGSFVIRHMAEHGTHEQNHRLMEIFRNSVNTLNFDGVTCKVIERVMEYSKKEDARAFALELSRIDGLIVRISQNRYGHLIVKSLFRLVADDAQELDNAAAQIGAAEQKLQQSRYGRAVLTACHQACHA